MKMNAVENVDVPVGMTKINILLPCDEVLCNQADNTRVQVSLLRTSLIG